MGVAFRRDLFVVTRQVYPELQDKEQLIHTKVQRRLVQKLGDNAIPFFFEVRRCWWEPNRALDRNLFCPSVSRQSAMFGGSTAWTF